MPWWAWALIVAWLTLGTAGAVMKARAGQMDLYYPDGCRRSFFDRAFRIDGEGNHLLPRRGDGALDDLEHLLQHRSHER